MPRQKPLIDTDKLDRDRGVQLDAIKSLAVRLQPTVSPDGSKVSVSNLVALMAKLDTLCSPTRPWNWLGLKKWAELTGISPRACSRTLHALKSLGLIEVEDRMVTQTLRRLAVRIRWENVIDSGTPQQDPELLALWGRKRAKQGRLFPASMTTPMRSSRPHGSGHHDHMGQVTMTTPTYIHPPNNPPNHPLGKAEGSWPMADGQRDGRVDGESFQFSAVSNHQENSNASEINEAIMAASGERSRTGTDQVSHVEQQGKDMRDLRVVSTHSLADGRDLVEQEKPANVGIGSLQPNAMKLTFPANFDTLVKFCVLLGIGSARSICKQSLQLGYSPDQIAEILNWYESQAIVERHLSQTNGPSRTARYPYSAGQLACRLRDPDGIGVSPELGNWKGGKCGLWSSLAAKTYANPPKVAQNRHQAAPDDIPVAPLVYRTTMTRQEIEAALQKQAKSSSRPPSPAVHTSLTRYQDGQPLPKTLAYWLIEAGYPVQRIEEGGQTT